MNARVAARVARICVAGLVPLSSVAAAAIVAAPGYAVRMIPTPGTVQGGVVRRGAVILVGQGTFGVGSESIIRLDAAATTIATGFNSLGGVDMDASGTLYVVDNGGAQAGAVTGDTLFAIPEALSRLDAVTAVGHEVVPKGTIPFAQDVLLTPDGAVLVSDAAGPGAGRVVRVQGSMATDLITGLDYAAGLALRPDETLLVGNVDATFTGAVFEYRLDGTRLGTLTSGLAGAFDQVLDNDANVLVSGGKTSDGSSGTVIAIAPDGTITERAHGFVFSTEMYFDATREELLVLDSGATAITAICRDRDGNGLCDADQPCTGPATVRKPQLMISKLTRPRGRQTLRFTGAMQLRVPFSPPLDPVAKGVRILVSDAAGTFLDAAIAGGRYDRSTKTGWKTNRSSTAWTYRNAKGRVSSIVTVTIKTAPKAPGLLKFEVRGRNGNYRVERASLPVTATMVIDAPHAISGQCAAVVFSGPPPAPACAFHRGGKTLHCQ